MRIRAVTVAVALAITQLQVVLAAPASAAEASGAGPAGASAQVSSPAQAKFERLADQFLDYSFRTNPSWATEEGIHSYDRQLGDFSAEGQGRQIGALKEFLKRFEKFNPEGLDQSHRSDLELVKSNIRASLLELESIQMWRKNPDLYSSAATASIFALIKRDFAPLEDRLSSVISRERQIGKVLAAGRSNLVNPPPIYTKVALEQMPGIVKFFRESVPQSFKPVGDGKLLAAFQRVNAQVVADLISYQKFLEDELLPRSKGDFALGADLYSKKLLYEEMVDQPIDDLLQRGYRELHRLQSEFIRTAGAIDQGQPASQVYQSIAKDHPKPDSLIASVAGVLEGIRKFCVDRSLVTIPSEQRATVEETPPFMRALTYASMDIPGPFEDKAKEAYYHVTLPDPTWSPEKVEEHMRSFCSLDLLNTSVHEAYPGHYVQFLWVRNAPSKIRKVLGCGTNSEGWAHYCEEMMLEQGLGNGDKRYKLVQLHDALLRACRYIVGIQMHTRGMTLEQGIAFFNKEGYQEQANAEREAKRGTLDPTYLMYTLGKLEIIALRDQYQKLRGKEFSLHDFHDRFLAEGCPPLKMVRKALLGEADKGVEQTRTNLSQSGSRL